MWYISDYEHKKDKHPQQSKKTDQSQRRISQNIQSKDEESRDKKIYFIIRII